MQQDACDDLASAGPVSDILQGKPVSFIESGHDSKGMPVKIHYAVLGVDEYGNGGNEDNRPKIVLLMGLAATCSAWKPQIEDLMLPKADLSIRGSPERSPVVICVIDNRGCGHSSSPRAKTDYTTTIMANDAFCVVDHLNWDRYHLVGFSMGGMIATKMASTRSHSLLSLTLLSTSTGGWHCLPRSWKAIRYISRIIRDKSAETRAQVDIRFHFSKATRKRWVPHLLKTQHDVLYEEYLVNSAAGPPIPKHGTSGQASACWNHSVSKHEAATIRSAGFPVMCAHGRHDVVCGLSSGEALAAKLQGTMMVLETAHMSFRERGHEVSFLLEALVLGAPRMADRQALDPTRHILGDLLTRRPDPVHRSGSAPTLSDQSLLSRKPLLSG